MGSAGSIASGLCPTRYRLLASALIGFVIVTGLALAPRAEAVALHALTPADCVADVGDLAGCGTTQQGLGSAAGVAVSPDGASVYVASSADSAIVNFDRASDGALTPAGCIADVGDVAGCGTTHQGLSGARDVAVSADGTSVYVASTGDSAIASFDRAPDGTLTPSGCVADAGSGVCATTQQGLSSPFDVAVSSDGGSVYGVGLNDDAIAILDRAEDGSLTPAGCIADVGDAVGCGTTQAGLDGARAIGISPDASSVYVGSFQGKALVRFDRASDGTLTPAGCIADVGDIAGCGTTQQGLDAVRGVAVSADGASVYTASFSDRAIASFDRGPDGTLTPAGCIADVGDTAGCGTTQQGLGEASDVTVTGDGQSVFVASSEDAVAGLDRAANGSLTPAGCIADVGDTAGCGTTQQGLSGAIGVAVSPDDGSVYLAGSADRAIARLYREVPPTCLGSAAAGPPGQVVTVPLDCFDANGDAQTIVILDSPSSGTLGVVNQANDTVSYTPNSGFTGNDVFSFRSIADGKRSNVATAYVDIEPPQGQTGPQGVPGPQGPQGPAGPEGEAAIKLLALLSDDKLKARSGKRLKLRYATSDAGEATAVVRKGDREVLERTKSADEAGVHKLGIKLASKRRAKKRRRAKKKPLKPGKYTLELTVTGEDGQEAVDSARLKVR